MKKAFTLLEVVIITVVIGILATFALPQYLKFKEKALDNEAKGYITTILSAEKIRKTETTSYYSFAAPTSQSQVDTINDTLEIFLPASGGKWNYSAKTYTPSVSTDPQICVQAERNMATKRYWRMYDTDLDEPEEGQCS